MMFMKIYDAHVKFNSIAMELKQLLGNCSLLPVKLTQHPQVRDIRTQRLDKKPLLGSGGI